MRITIAAVGRGRSGPEQQLYDEYVKRLSWPLFLKEVEAKKSLEGDALKAAEAKLLLEAAPKGALLVALDERGRNITSMKLAEWIEAKRLDGKSDLCFLIGGADGLDPAIRAQADLVLACGSLTWPHLLVRAMLAEQIYRCQQILAGHPYHREG
ncbi:MAG: 23S rRNA (pseudouridine(1915)-N(3))-methyltransferase RlmH [Marivibrio sp.]|uniref:23S rRNA (pseudouridine(1915)-N(3))-methyltransferase RlmH n=1 Tax=Marivibrio sp. TaxID=2039719 RepID=UPI0032ED54DF